MLQIAKKRIIAICGADYMIFPQTAQSHDVYTKEVVDDSKVEQISFSPLITGVAACAGSEKSLLIQWTVHAQINDRGILEPDPTAVVTVIPTVELVHPLK